MDATAHVHDAAATGRQGLPRLRNGVFISYARADGADAAASLRGHLQQAGIAVWQDLSDLQAGEGWWAQIREALRRVEYLVLVLTDGAIRSPVVMQECQAARQEGVTVLPLLPGATALLESPPRWLAQLHWYSMPQDLSRLAADVRRTPPLRRVPFMVEGLPPDFVARMTELEKVVASLVGPGSNEPVAITAAMRGAGGYGKTTLARAVCHDSRVRDAYVDGILWVTLGEKPTLADLLGRVTDLVEALQGERPGYASLDAATARLREAIADRELLLVIDDVWHPEHAQPFLSGGPRCTRLITTRHADALPPGIEQVAVEQMDKDQALQLLGHGLPAADPLPMRRLAARLGDWPLLLRLANGVLHQRLQIGREPVAAALAWMHLALDKRGVVAFDARQATERNRAVALTIGVSLDQLTPQEVERFLDLAVFPEDLDVPLEVVARLWRAGGGLDALDAEELMLRLAAISLVQRLDLPGGTLRLHDAVRHFAIGAQGQAAGAARHARLLDALCSGHAAHRAALTEPYLLRHLAMHLAGAGRVVDLVAAVKDVGYAASRIGAHKSWALMEDLLQARAAAPDDQALLPMARELARISHLLDPIEDTIALTQTLRARWGLLVGATLACVGGAGDDGPPWFVAERPLPGLHPNLSRTVLREGERMRCVAFMPDGRSLLCCAASGLAWILDLETGRTEAVLEAPGERVNACAASPDGRWVATVTDGGRLHLWDAEDGSVLVHPRATRTRLLSCAVRPDGQQLAAGGADDRVHVWAPDAPEKIRVLHGHVAAVTACAYSPDGALLASVGADGRCCLWDGFTGTLLRTLQAHALPAACCTFTPDGSALVTGSLDGCLRWWDPATGQCLHDRRAHRCPVRGCVSVGGGWLLSAGDDGTTTLWRADTADTRPGPQIQALPLRGLAANPGGDVYATVAEEGTVQLWQFDTGDKDGVVARTPGLMDLLAVSANGACLLVRDGRGSCVLWQSPWEQPRALDPPPPQPVHGACLSADGAWLAAATAAGDIWLWPTAPGSQGRRLQTCEPPVRWCTFTADGSHLLWQPDSGPAVCHDLRQAQPARHLELPADQPPYAGPGAAWLAMAFGPDHVEIVDGCTGQAAEPVRAPFGGGTGAAPDGTRWVELTAAQDTIARCAFAPDGRHLVASGDDGLAVVWDLDTGLRVHTCERQAHWVWGCALAGDGGVHTAGWDGSLRWHPAGASAPARRIDAHTAAVVDLALSADGGRLATASQDGTLALWDAKDGRLVTRLRPLSGAPGCCAWGADGRLVASGNVAGIWSLWDAATGALLHEVQAHHGAIHRVMLVDGSRHLLTVADDGSAACWDTASSTLVRRWSVAEGPVVDAATPGDGGVLLTLDGAGVVALWDLASGSLISQQQAVPDAGRSTACAISPCGRRVVVAQGRRLFVRRAADLQCERVLPQRLPTRVLHAGVAATALQVDGTEVWLWHPDAWERHPWRAAGAAGVMAPHLLQSAARRAVFAEETCDDAERWELRLRAGGDEPFGLALRGSLSITGIAADPAGRLAALACGDGVLRVCDLLQRRWVATLHTGDELRGCSWLENGQLLVAAGALGLYLLRCHWTAPDREGPATAASAAVGQQPMTALDDPVETRGLR